MEIFKGVTPTFSLKSPETIDLTEATSIVVTFTDGYRNVQLEKEGDDLTVTAHQIDLFLTQEETLAMPKLVRIQVNFLFGDNGLVRRVASVIKDIDFEANLKPEVME